MKFRKIITFTLDSMKLLRFNTRIGYIKGGVLNECIERHKKAAANDWHRADILAALRKNGWSLRSLAQAGNVSYNTLKTALDKPYPKMERLIANAVGVAPEEIWAARSRERIERNRRPVLTNKF